MSRKIFTALAALSIVAAPAAAQQKVKIGIITTQSGPGAVLGREIVDGFNLGIKHSGGRLGGAEAEVIVGDEQFKPEVGKALAEGAIAPWAKGDRKLVREALDTLSRTFSIDLELPFRRLPRKIRDLLFFGALGAKRAEETPRKTKTREQDPFGAGFAYDTRYARFRRRRKAALQGDHGRRGSASCRDRERDDARLGGGAAAGAGREDGAE